MSVLSRYFLVSPSTTPSCSCDLVLQPHSGCHGYRDSRVTIQHCLCVTLQICCLATIEEKWQSMLANTTPLDGITALLRQSWDWAWRQRLVWFPCFTGFHGGACGYCRVQPYDGKVAHYIHVHFITYDFFGKDLRFRLQVYGIWWLAPG